MKRWKKGVLAAVLCAVLALCAAIPASGASSGTVYLMAVNDTVVETTAENMPAMMGGVLYVPYTMLSTQASGINLGVNAMYSATRRTVLVIDNAQRGITFDTQSNTAQDLNGEAVSVRAMVRNSMVFVPIDYLCEYFGSISCTRVRTQYGTLIRVTNSRAVLDDVNFVSAADNLLADSLQNYLATVDPASQPGTAAPPLPEDSSAPSQAELYLAFRWGEQAGDAAQLLEGRGERGLFLFTCDELRAQDGLVRRLVGAGHTIGLALEGGDGEDCLAQAQEGRLLLASIARYPLLIVSADGLEEGGREALAQAGFVLWGATSRGEDYPTGQALVEGLDPQRVNRVELACGEGCAAFLRGALAAMEEENCRVYLATAPELE